MKWADAWVALFLVAAGLTIAAFAAGRPADAAIGAALAALGLALTDRG